MVLDGPLLNLIEYSEEEVSVSTDLCDRLVFSK